MKITKLLTKLLFFGNGICLAIADGNSTGNYTDIDMQPSDADWWEIIWEKLECPDPVKFANETGLPLTCVGNAIPPWPICLFHSIPYFIEASISSASRCCNFDDLEECRCPMKDNPEWKVKMEDWCENIATCPRATPIKVDLVSEFWARDVLFPGSEADLSESEEDSDESCDCDILDVECINDCYDCGCESESEQNRLACVVQCYEDAEVVEKEASRSDSGCGFLNFECVNDYYDCGCEDEDNPRVCVLLCYYDETESWSWSEDE